MECSECSPEDIMTLNFLRTNRQKISLLQELKTKKIKDKSPKHDKGKEDSRGEKKMREHSAGLTRISKTTKH